MDMVTKVLTAQNFAMPAGYVEQDGVNYMVSIGDEIEYADEITLGRSIVNRTSFNDSIKI